MTADREEPTPRVPRGKWFGKAPRTVEIMRIGMVGTLLVVILVLGRPCAEGMSRFVESFAPAPDAAPAAPALQYERLTEEQIRKRFPGGFDAGVAPAPAPAP